MTRNRLTLPVALAFSALTLVGCGREEAPPADSVAAAPAPPAPAMVTTIETGKTIGADKRIMDTTTTFGIALSAEKRANPVWLCRVSTIPVKIAVSPTTGSE